MKHAQVIILLVLAPFATGCSVSDDERCENGMYWDDEYKACIIETDTGTGIETGTEPDTSSAANDVGTPCADNADCPLPPADYCLLDPTHPNDPGMCTIDNCSSGDCPEGHLCCDCTTVTLVPFPSPLCLPTANTDQLTPLGCVCD